MAKKPKPTTLQRTGYTHPPHYGLGQVWVAGQLKQQTGCSIVVPTERARRTWKGVLCKNCIKRRGARKR